MKSTIAMENQCFAEFTQYEWTGFIIRVRNFSVQVYLVIYNTDVLCFRELSHYILVYSCKTHLLFIQLTLSYLNTLNECQGMFSW